MFRRKACYPLIIITLGFTVVVLIWLPIECITVILGIALIWAGIKLIC